MENINNMENIEDIKFIFILGAVIVGLAIVFEILHSLCEINNKFKNK